MVHITLAPIEPVHRSRDFRFRVHSIHMWKTRCNDQVEKWFTANCYPIVKEKTSCYVQSDWFRFLIGNWMLPENKLSTFKRSHFKESTRSHHDKTDELKKTKLNCNTKNQTNKHTRNNWGRYPLWKQLLSKMNERKKSFPCLLLDLLDLLGWSKRFFKLCVFFSSSLSLYHESPQQWPHLESYNMNGSLFLFFEVNCYVFVSIHAWIKMNLAVSNSNQTKWERR